MKEMQKQAGYLPEGTWYGFWDKKRFVSRGEWIELDTASLDSIHLWVKSGSIICWAKDRARTFNNVGSIETVQVYGSRTGAYTCDDGQGGLIKLLKNPSGKWSCKGRDDVCVNDFS